VQATADGVVAYVNRKAGLSNYGNYLLVRHQIEGLEIYSLYAHLSSVRADLNPGRPVRAGETIATLGRTSNTRQRISKDRAHVHFELDFVVNPRFDQWHVERLPGQRNDHGNWNGQNLLGIDPRWVFLAQAQHGTNFSLLRFMQSQVELCRVAVHGTRLPWLNACAPLIQRNPVADREGVAGYELTLNFNGVPYRIIPRAASELKGGGKFQLLAVNEAEEARNGCRRLIANRGGRWELTNRGEALLDLLTY
jgi:murein DD-endopeptidase MepM/ murein hydrolase activator NlpD